MRATGIRLLAVAAVAIASTAAGLHALGFRRPPASDRPAIDDGRLAELPMADAYRALAESEQWHQRRLAAAADPARAAADRRKALQEALAAGEAGRAALAEIGYDLFLLDVPVPGERRPLTRTTRCMSCHWRGGPGGGGGLVDGQLDGRNPPALAGSALLERLAAEMTAEIQAQASRGLPLRTHGVSFGTRGSPDGVAADLVVRPFGRTGRWATLDEAIGHMGTHALGIELDAGERSALAAFLAALPVPSLEPPDSVRLADLYEKFPRGERLFSDLGCATCHVPSMTLADGTRIAAFTDLKRHDLGYELAQGENRLWLTPPLWGVAVSPPWLHDGRALASLDLAIKAHGGEAASARDKYLALSAQEQGPLKLFLLSLAPKPRFQVAGR